MPRNPGLSDYHLFKMVGVSRCTRLPTAVLFMRTQSKGRARLHATIAIEPGRLPGDGYGRIGTQGVGPPPLRYGQASPWDMKQAVGLSNGRPFFLWRF